MVSDSDKGAALTVFFSDDLELTRENISMNGGVIVKPIFSFPGGVGFILKNRVVTNLQFGVKFLKRRCKSI